MKRGYRSGRRGRRLMLIALAGVALGTAAALVLYALGDRITYAPTPSELAAGQHAPGERIRLAASSRRARWSVARMASSPSR